MAVELFSLNKHIAELDRMEATRNLTMSCYAAAIRSVADHVVRFEGMFVEQHRQEMLKLAGLLEENDDAAALKRSRVAFATAQQRFQHQAEDRLAELRSNLSATSKLLQDMMTQFSGVGAKHHQGLEGDIQQLKALQALAELESLKMAVGETADRMSVRLEEMKRENQLVITQLQDEIRSLHRELEQKRSDSKPETVEPAAAIRELAAAASQREEVAGMRRQDLESALRNRAEQGDTYCLTVVWLSNLAQLFTRYKPDLVLDLMAAAANRLVETVGDKALWAKWEDDCFVVHSAQAKPAAAKFSQELAARLSGDYEISHNGEAARLHLKVTAGVVERGKDDSFERVVQRADQLVKSLRALP